MYRLLASDEIRVIAPSQSWSSKRKYRIAYDRAKKRLESCGYKVTLSKNIDKVFHLGTASAQQRADYLNDAYRDKNVKAVMALGGGWSANEILPLIDWELVAQNPKPLIGYSDITVLHNAIYAKTGNVGLLGPAYGTIGAMTSWRYTLDNLNAVLTQGSDITLKRSARWGIGKSALYNTKPWKVLFEGKAEAVLLGGNLGTLYLLQGTEYQPKFDKPFIFALEDDDEAGEYTLHEVSRRLESLLQLPHFRDNLRGVIIGRFQPDGKVHENDLISVIESKNLGDIPILLGVDFGHTLPMVTLPIGGVVRLDTIGGKRVIEIIRES
jgi:muramoyltetrapeptide carboxypeptidase